MKYNIELNEKHKIHLIPFSEKDIYNSNYLNWFENEKITEFTSHGLFPYTEEEKILFLKNIGYKKILIWKIEIYDKKSFISWIGNVSLQSFNWVNRTAELAIIIGNKEWQKKGIAKKVCKKIIGHGFNKLNLHKIWLGTAKSNQAMVFLSEKIGMTLEGQLREELFLNGQYVDILKYGIIKP